MVSVRSDFVGWLKRCANTKCHLSGERLRFCWQATRNYLYTDLSRRNCIWYLFMFFSCFFSSSSIISQVPIFANLQHLTLLFFPFRNDNSFCLPTRTHSQNVRFSFFGRFVVFGIKSTCWNIFKSILVLREFNACWKVEFVLSNFRVCARTILSGLYSLLLACLYFFGFFQING